MFKSPKSIILAGTSWNPKGILHMLTLVGNLIPTPTGHAVYYLTNGRELTGFKAYLQLMKYEIIPPVAT